MGDKEIWLVLYQGILNGRSQGGVAAVVADAVAADKALMEYNKRWQVSANEGKKDE
tara:strand:+ start:15872 stop:16039 length:168 start_codon:yes stop_codon:yes gene_type:complete